MVKEQTEQGMDGDPMLQMIGLFDERAKRHSDTKPNVSFLLKLRGLSKGETDGTKTGTHFN